MTLHEIGLSYVGISLDGLEEVHDAFRGVNGAFERAMAAIDNCRCRPQGRAAIHHQQAELP